MYSILKTKHSLCNHKAKPYTNYKSKYEITGSVFNFCLFSTCIDIVIVILSFCLSVTLVIDV